MDTYGAWRSCALDPPAGPATVQLLGVHQRRDGDIPITDDDLMVGHGSNRDGCWVVEDGFIPILWTPMPDVLLPDGKTIGGIDVRPMWMLTEDER